MKKRLRILHLEDSPRDAELIHATLDAAGIEFELTRTDDEKGFCENLDKGNWDIILSDYNLPSFGGMRALSLAQERFPKIPFILISGAIGEELAVEALRNGATDYILKDRLSRLAHAIERTMNEVEKSKERERLEEQFRQAQKMEAVGQLAGGIAHDFNNMLTVINGYSEIRVGLLPEGDLIRADFEEILKAGKRAKELVSQILAFSRRQIFQPKILNLNDLIQDMSTMFRRLIPANIDLVLLPAVDLGSVSIDPDSFHQVTTNLVVNASHAMPQGGKITISTKNVVGDANAAQAQREIPAGEYVLLTVGDTGSGMSDDVKAHLFEPFFTTKEKGKGTGLGLATIYGIVKQSGGFIRVESELGKGTSFLIYLPRVQAQANTNKDVLKAGPLLRGTETIILAEDSDQVRAFVATVLRQQGYEVLESQSGEQALQKVMAREKHQPIHLLLTDMVMPGMGGAELADKIKTLCPGIQIIFASGYTENKEIHAGNFKAGEAFLQKPFSPLALTNKIREVLDQSKAGVA